MYDSDKRMIQYKINLRNKILQLYKQHGYNHAVKSVKNLINNANKKTKEFGDKSLAINTRGECCEILLEIQILEFAKSNNLPWILTKGTTIRRKDYKKGGTTELDLTLFTPSKIILLESKYRMGKIKLIDKCTIVPSYGNVTDVYKQNIMHLDNLRYYLADAIIDLKKGSPFSIALYVEETKRVEDLRSEENKKLVPLIGEENIFEYLTAISKMKQKVWDIKKLQVILQQLDSESDALFEEHIERVKNKK